MRRSRAIASCPTSPSRILRRRTTRTVAILSSTPRSKRCAEAHHARDAGGPREDRGEANPAELERWGRQHGTAEWIRNDHGFLLWLLQPGQVPGRLLRQPDVRARAFRKARRHLDDR